MELSPHELARRIALRQSSGLDARNLLAPPPVEAIMLIKLPLRRKKVKATVNHQTKHKSLLKDMQNQIRTYSKEQQDKERDEKEKMIRLRLKSVGQVESKLFPLLKNLSLGNSSTEPPTCKTTTTTTRSVAGDSNRLSIPTLFQGTSTSSTGSTLSSSPYPAPMSNMSETRQRLNNEVLNKRETFSSNQDERRISIVKHTNYGRVPTYILERRIELAEEDQGNVKSNKENRLRKTNAANWNGSSTLSSVYNSPDIYTVKLTDMRIPEKQKLWRELSENEAKIKKELEKLPFGLQSEGSIRKRNTLYDSMKDIEQKKKIVLSTPTRGRRGRR